MASTADVRESALRTSLFGLLCYTTHGMESSLDIAGAIASALAIVYATVAEFANESNRTRGSVLWNRLPEELKLETARWLPHAQRVMMLGVSRDVRDNMLSNSSLWTKISLPRRCIDKTERVEFLQTMVPRSGHSPIDLEWTSPCVNASTLLQDAPRDIILSVLPRARTLTLHPSYFQLGPRTFWTAPTPLLESLTISNGTDNSCIVLKSSWPAKDLPLLRDLRLDTVFFPDRPLAPFQGIVRLEATMGMDAAGERWEHIWAWFPCLERFIAHVRAFEPPSIPSPPDTLRHVTLLGGGLCKVPERVVCHWEVHNVRILEIFSSERSVLCDAVAYLLRCDPGLWTGSFATACCAERGSLVSIVLRGQSATVVVRSGLAQDHGPQILDARRRTTLLDKLHTLTLSGPALGAMFTGCPTLPVLRSLTVIRTVWETLGLFSNAQPSPKLRAPVLERLTIDMRQEKRFATEDQVIYIGIHRIMYKI